MYQNWFCLSLIKAGTNLYAIDKKGNTALSYAIGQFGKDAIGGVPDVILESLLKACLERGFDIFKRPNGKNSPNTWEQLCGAGRITEPLLRVLKQYLKGTLNLTLLEQGKEIMKKHNVVWKTEIGEALVKIAEEIMDGTSKKVAAETLFLYHHRR